MQGKIAYIVSAIMALAGIALFILGKPGSEGDDVKDAYDKIPQSFPSKANIEEAMSMVSATESEIQSKIDSLKAFIGSPIHSDYVGSSEKDFRTVEYRNYSDALKDKLRKLSNYAGTFTGEGGEIENLSIAAQKELRESLFADFDSSIKNRNDDIPPDEQAMRRKEISCFRYVVDMVDKATNGNSEGKILEFRTIDFDNFVTPVAVTAPSGVKDLIERRPFVMRLELDAAYVDSVISTFAEMEFAENTGYPRIHISGIMLTTGTTPRGAQSSEFRDLEHLKKVHPEIIVPALGEGYRNWATSPTVENGWQSIQKEWNLKGLHRFDVPAALTLEFHHLALLEGEDAQGAFVQLEEPQPEN